jgi:ribonuclease T2
VLNLLSVNKKPGVRSQKSEANPRLYRQSARFFALFLIGLSVALGQPQSGQPGNFDYYLFTLSWSPEYCQAHRDAVECTGGNHYGFIVHGLWPQFNRGYPEHCSNEPMPSDVSVVSKIMPDPSLIKHEWTTHGTCSGLSGNQYFELIRKIYDSIKIPQQFVAPTRTLNIHPADVKRAFEQANPQLSDDAIAVNCPQNFLSGMQICVTKGGTPFRCPGGAVRDCRARNINIPPVR